MRCEPLLTRPLARLHPFLAHQTRILCERSSPSSQEYLEIVWYSFAPGDHSLPIYVDHIYTLSRRVGCYCMGDSVVSGSAGISKQRAAVIAIFALSLLCRLWRAQNWAMHARGMHHHHHHRHHHQHIMANCPRFIFRHYTYVSEYKPLYILPFKSEHIFWCEWRQEDIGRMGE